MLSLKKYYLKFKYSMRRFERLYMLLGACKRAVTQGPKVAYREWKDTVRIRSAKIAKWPTEAETAAARAQTFDRKILFSVVVPLYNTPEKFLREMIESVQGQTYGDWELCLAEGSDQTHPDPESVCRD